MSAIGGHQSAKSRTDEWITPPRIIQSLGEFDLDPCSPINRPFDTAKHHYTIIDDGLKSEWFGRVWLNPPYGREIEKWMAKMANYGNGIALIFARTETNFFFESIWNKASSILFIRKRIAFLTVAGKVAGNTGGAPSCLIAYGEYNSDALEQSGIDGKHLPVNYTPVIIVGVSPTWKSVVSIAFTRIGPELNLDQIYSIVETIAPDKIAKNSFYKEKIRQTLQKHFKRIDKGVYSNKLFDSILD